MKKIILILLSIILFSCEEEPSGIISKSNGTSSYYELLEYAYSEGQKDALNGDVKIEKISDSCYKWISSPWNDGRKPIYDLSKNCEVNE